MNQQPTDTFFTADEFLEFGVLDEGQHLKFRRLFKGNASSMIDVYLREAELSIGTLGEAAENCDHEQFRGGAHRLKSSSAYLGVMRLHHMAKWLEQNVWQLAQSDMHRAHAEMQAILVQLPGLFKRQGNPVE